MPSKYAPTRQRKHRLRARAEIDTPAAAASGDSNAPVHFPSTTSTEKPTAASPSQSAPSGKKKKRLDKYLEKKLRKDESMGYLKMLEGQKEREDEVRRREGGGRAVGGGRGGAGVGMNLGKRKRGKDAVVREIREEEERGGSDGDSEDEWERKHPEVFEEGEEGGDEVVEAVGVLQVAGQVGSGLAQPLRLGADGLPVIETRGKKKKRKKQITEEHEEPWEGFSDGDEDGDKMELDAPMDKVALIEALMEDVEEYESSDDLEGSGEQESDLESEEFSGEGVVSMSGSDSQSDSDSAVSSTSDTSAEQDGKLRTSAFKAWATQQLNQSMGHTPSYDQRQLPSLPKPSNPEPAAASLMTRKPSLPQTNRKAYAVHINRSPEIQASRSELPIIAREQEIMEAIHNSPVIIIKGDTGSGKTTQVPQFLYESGYGSRDGPTPGMIGITQPRRIAATSMAERVADEMGDHGHRVAHQIRYDSNITPETAVKFMTDGILIRELQEDLLLRKYSVIVIDEAHERSVNTDVLIGILSKVVPARLRKNQWNQDPKPLQVVIMSATLNVEQFLDDRLFGPGSKPPIVQVEGRQHRVTAHFALRSRVDYLEEIVEKVRRAHRKLPKGGILVFLTGQNEIRQVGQQLQQHLGRHNRDSGFMNGPRVQLATSETPLELEDMEFENPKQMVETQDDFDEVEIIADNSDDEAAEEREFDISDDESSPRPTTPATASISKDPYTSVHILPLYAQIPKREQHRIFESPPPGHRLIVLATNVAETSITIPDIRYVFDTGRAKERKYNLDSGVQSFEIDYISKASAAQRAGRAGRTGPGHCWRLYTSAVYEHFFPEHSKPQILSEPAESVVLTLKGFDYPKPVHEFPFPSTPSFEALAKAESLLRNLGALTNAGKINELGRELRNYPLSPRLGRIMAAGIQSPKLLQQVIALVAGLAVQEIFVPEAALDLNAQDRNEENVYSRQDQLEDEERDKKKQALGRAKAILSRQDKASDAIKLLTAVSTYNAASDKEAICKEFFLRPKAMFEVVELHRQLIRIVKSNDPMLTPALTQISKPSTKEFKQLNTVCASGYIDQVAIRADLSPNPPEVSQKPRRAIDVPFLPLIPLTDKGGAASLLERAIFLHPSSVLAKQSVKDLPKFIVYTHLQKSQSRSVGGEEIAKTRMFPLAPVDGTTLIQLAKDTALLEYGRPVPGMKIEEIRGVPKRRECFVSTELRAGTRGFGWPLASVKVRQVMDIKTSSGWRTEEIL